MKELTEKQEELYNTIKDYIQEHRYSPSFRDLCELLEKNSTATISYGLKQLKRKGYIEYQPKRMRTIKLVKEV